MAIAIDGATTANGTATPLTWSHTVGAGQARLLVVGVSIRKEADPRPTVTGVTYAGIALTQAVAAPNDGKTSSDIWILANPPVGAANVSVTMSSTPTNVVGGAVSLFGVDQLQPVVRSGIANGSSNAPSRWILAEPGTLALGVASSVASLTATGSQTQRWSGSNSFLHGRGGTIDGAGGFAQLTWSIGSSQLWTVAAVTLRAYVDNAAVPETSGGAISIRPELWIATAENAFVEDITALLIEGAVDMNVDTAIAGACTIKVRNPDQIAPYADFLAPRLRIAYEDGRDPELRQLGLYATRIPPGEFTRTRAEATFAGQDMTSVLASVALTDVWNIAASANIREAMSDLIEYAGLTRYVLPESTVTLASAYSFQPGMTVLDAVNTLCDMLGWYHVTADLEGFIVSAGEVRALADMEPFATYATADIRSPSFVVNPSDLQIVNVVVAINTNNAVAPLVSVQRNDDPASPTSTVSLEREISYPGGAIQVAGEITQARLDMIARRYLRDGRSYYRTGQFSVLPNPDALIPHQSVALALDGEMTPFSGLWYVRTARMGMRPQDVLLSLEVNQTRAFDGTAL